MWLQREEKAREALRVRELALQNSTAEIEQLTAANAELRQTVERGEKSVCITTKIAVLLM